jgi:hypothetical protein
LVGINNDGIKRIGQEDEEGIGIACVAMVSGKTYPQAKKFFLERVFLPTERKPHIRWIPRKNM